MTNLAHYNDHPRWSFDPKTEWGSRFRPYWIDPDTCTRKNFTGYYQFGALAKSAEEVCPTIIKLAPNPKVKTEEPSKPPPVEEDDIDMVL